MAPPPFTSQHFSPAGGQPARGLEGDPALAALIDSAAFVRQAFGPDSDRDRARNEVLLAVAYAGVATKREVADMLCRDASTVHRQLLALRRDGQLVSRADPRATDRLLWRLKSASKHLAASQVRAVALSRARLVEDAAALLHASRQMPAAALRVPPVRARAVANALAGGGVARLRSRREAGGALQALREHAGLTQRQLAAAAGISLAEVRRLEGGQQRLDVASLLLCCGALGARLADVMVA